MTDDTTNPDTLTDDAVGLTLALTDALEECIPLWADDFQQARAIADLRDSKSVEDVDEWIVLWTLELDPTALAEARDEIVAILGVA
jgi:hypothetical protein